jgi:hypothetical protein
VELLIGAAGGSLEVGMRKVVVVAEFVTPKCRIFPGYTPALKAVVALAHGGDMPMFSHPPGASERLVPSNGANTSGARQTRSRTAQAKGRVPVMAGSR